MSWDVQSKSLSNGDWVDIYVPARYEANRILLKSREDNKSFKVKPAGYPDDQYITFDYDGNGKSRIGGIPMDDGPIGNTLTGESVLICSVSTDDYPMTVEYMAT